MAAQEAVLQYSSELLAFESRQVLRSGKPVRYADGAEGEQLRRLLDPARTGPLIDKFMQEERKHDRTPDLNEQIRPLLQRYMKAFYESPAEYEAEYLNVLFWHQRVLKLSLQRMATQSPEGADPMSVQMLAVGRSMLVSAAGFFSSGACGLSPARGSSAGKACSA